MRFISEFTLSDAEINHSRIPVVEYRKRQSYVKMGELIGDIFGWEERCETTLYGPVFERHKLEIEAFPMDKWIEFKQKLFDQLHEGIIPSPARNEIKISKLIKELESFGKPAGV